MQSILPDIPKFPLKIPAKCDISGPLLQFVNQNSQTQAALPLTKTIAKIQNLRDNLSVVHNLDSINACEEYSTQLKCYIRHINLISRQFNIDDKVPSIIQICFVWHDSFSHKLFTRSGSIYFELACVYYNLAALYYILGNFYTASSNKDQKKLGIKQLRYGLGCVSKVKESLSSVQFGIIKEERLPGDLYPQNLQILEMLLYGFGYIRLYEVLEDRESELGSGFIGAVVKESLPYFQTAFQIITEQKNMLPPQHLQTLQSMIPYYHFYYQSLVQSKIAKHHIKQIEIDKLGKHMGKAVSQAKSALEILSRPKNNLDQWKLLEKNFQNQIEDFYSRILHAYTLLNEKNSKIYYEPVEQVNSLESVVEFPEKYKIAFLIPEDLEPTSQEQEPFSTIAQEKQILNYLNADLVEVKNQLELKKHILMEKRLKLSHDNMINTLIKNQNTQTSDENLLPQSIIIKIKDFQKSCGYNYCVQALNRISQNYNNCQKQIQQLNNYLTEESQYDVNMRKLYGNQWIDQQSEDLTSEFFSDIMFYNTKLQESQVSDELLLFRVLKENKDQLQKFSKQLKDIAQSFGLTGLEYNTTKNQASELLKQMLEELENLEEEQGNIISTISGISTSDCISQKIQQMMYQGSNQNQILVALHEILYEKRDKFLEIEKKIEKQLNEISIIASEIQNQRQFSQDEICQAQKFETVNQSISSIHELQKGIEYGLQFYQELFQRLKKLESNISNFIQARKLKREKLIQQIGPISPNPPAGGFQGVTGIQYQLPDHQAVGRFSAPNHKNFKVNQQYPEQQQKIFPINPAPYFNEDTMEFPIGQSIIITNPSNRTSLNSKQCLPTQYNPYQVNKPYVNYEHKPFY